MQSQEQIIHAKWLITCEEDNKILENHALVLKNGKIHAVLPSKNASIQYPSATTSHYSQHAIVPGFINSHTHIGMNFFRGLADDLTLMDWLNNHIWPAEKQWVQQDFVHDASLFAMAEMLRSGTTCFNDMYFFLDATAQAALTAGIRAHIGITVIDFPTAWASTTQEYLEKGLAFHEAYKKYDNITATFAPHAIYTVSEKTLSTIKELADQHQLKINMHIQESRDEIEQSLAQTKKRPIRRLHDIGFLSPQVIAIHMTQIDDEDLTILQHTQPHIVHCPESNMKLASGACPVMQLQAAGLNIALGTDSVASNNNLDMIGEMRSAALLAKLQSGNPKAVDAEQALKMATLQGAKALGIEQMFGSLTVGKAADFIAIDLAQIETQPLYHPISQIVYAASRHQITDVWVAGKQLLKNRQLTTLDETELLNKAHFWREKIKN
ncbi:MAG: N-ethylammeline chlorohydrolase [Gammaproteobacteria bacterium RIFCSPHIGHO2_12_FULL_41_20]|nr:MAG: N-ethylammeline chlorohydrolase [Gammaproteobacteria bacterium RIFCSPHIGHO2_12_FULL_41_20]